MQARLYLVATVFLLFSLCGTAQNPRNLLIEDVTSTNCGHCPCMDTILQQVILKKHPGTVVVAIHGPMSTYNNNDFAPLIDSLRFESDGSAQVNRMGEALGPEIIADSVDARYSRMEESPVKMEIVSKNFDENTRLFTMVVKLTALQAGMNGVYRINSAILESNLISYQEHFPECPGGNQYNHRFVLRGLKFIPVGDVLVNGDWPQQSAITRTFIMDIDEDWVAANCDMIVFLDKMNGALNHSEIQQVIKQGVTRPVGIDQHTTEMKILKLVPNPAHDRINVHFQLSGAGLIKVVLFDQNGKEVKKITERKLAAGIYNLEADLAGIAAGQYILRIEQNQQITTEKLQIQ